MPGGNAAAGGFFRNGGGILRVSVFCRNFASMSLNSIIDYTCHLVESTASLREALGRLNALPGERMTLFVVDDGRRLMGSLTDGDVRRALLRGVGIDDSVALAMHPQCRSVSSDRPEVLASLPADAGINALPLLDREGRVIGIIDPQATSRILPIDAVLMAGGKGERLRPLTERVPKPLLTVGGKAIIDYNVDALRSCGVTDISVTVNYLKEQLEEHFQRRGDGVVCVAEPRRMGTFGSLSLVPKPRHENVLVMNSDLLTNLSFEAMYRRHVESGAVLTMAVVPYKVSVPFAIVDTDGDRVRDLREKPVYNYFANAGVYLLRSDLLGEIAPDTYLDAPDFIQGLIDSGRKVSYFPIEGTWIDIGSPEDYRRADELMSR